MSTAGRPTYSAAIGRVSTSTIRTQLVSSKDQVSHTTLKFRQRGQSSQEESRVKAFREELEAKEKMYVSATTKDIWLAKEEEKVDVKLLLANDTTTPNQKDYDDSDVSITSSKDSDSFASRYTKLFLY
jgi:hypothetical protein